MAREPWDPSPERKIIVLVDAASLHKAERLIVCEGCDEDSAQIPFDNIIDRVTGSDPSVTDYLQGSPGDCPEL